MTIGQWLLTIATILLAAHFLRRWSEKIFLSSGAVVVGCGLLFSGLISWLDFDTGLRWSNLSNLILQLLLPLMVYAGACRLSRQNLTRHYRLTLYLSLPGFLIGVLVFASVLWLTLNLVYPIGFELALLVAFIAGAPDPFCLKDYFRRRPEFDQNLRVLEQESVLIDAIVVVGYTFISLHHTGALDGWGQWQMALFFTGNLVGEFLAGALCATIAWFSARRCSHPMQRQLIGIACVLLAMGLCQQWLVTSGLLAAFITGIACGDAETLSGRNEQQDFVWSELLEYICSVFILVLFGLSLTVEMFEHHWPAMLCACLASLLARAVVVSGAVRLTPVWIDKQVLFVGYSQCAVPVAIVLSLTTEIESWYLIQSMIYGVAVMTILVRGPTLALLLRQSTVSHR